MGADQDDRDLLVRIDTKLDVALKQQADHETRIRRIERNMWLALGAAAVGGGTLSQLLGHFT